MDISECFKSREDNTEEKYKPLKLLITSTYGTDLKLCSKLTSFKVQGLFPSVFILDNLITIPGHTACKCCLLTDYVYVLVQSSFDNTFPTVNLPFPHHFWGFSGPFLNFYEFNAIFVARKVGNKHACCALLWFWASHPCWHKSLPSIIDLSFYPDIPLPQDASNLKTKT